jgi:short-subunit dehydrogenase
MISKKSGVILNVNSGAGKTGFSNLSAYCASKFGLLGLAESLALEVREYGNIRVLTIFLGKVATKMWQEYDFRYYQKIRAKCFSLMMWQKKLLKCYLILRPTKMEIHLKCTAMIFESTWIDCRVNTITELLL